MRIVRIAILILLAASTCLSNGDVAYGRAGGGGGFSGGGGFGGGGFSGGGFGGGGFGGGGFAFGSGGSDEGGAIEGTFVLVIVVLLILFQLYKHYYAPSAKGSASPSDFSYRAIKHDEKTAEAVIRSADPNFNTEQFLTRVSAAFLKVQDAWQQQNLQPARHFISDGIWERFSLQIQEQKDLGYRDHMEQIEFRSSLLAEAKAAGVFDVLTVQITASAIDYRVSLESGKYLSGNRSPERFTEFWSFVRRRGVHTKADQRGLMEGFCPNCGDAVRINRFARCASCEAFLRSGEYDWVLAEITQGSVWQPKRDPEDEIAYSYRERRDPGFSIQHLEDRTSVIFWRKAMADRLGTVNPLLKMATDDLCQQFADHYEKHESRSERRYLGGCAVGSVEFRGIVETDNSDYALVQIHWSANEFSVRSDGAIYDHERWSRYRHLFVLMRKRGVQSNIQRSIDSAHCPNCGAPESDVASDACEFCNTVLNDGSHDWVLSEYLVQYSTAAREWYQKAERAVSLAASPDADPSYADLLAWMVKVVASDKKIDRREQTVIRHLAAKQGMPEPVLAGLMNSALRGELDAPSPPSRRAGRVWLERLADVALLDDHVETDERELLEQLGKRIGWGDFDVKLVINKRRAERKREARRIASR